MSGNVTSACISSADCKPLVAGVGREVTVKANFASKVDCTAATLGVTEHWELLLPTAIKWCLTYINEGADKVRWHIAGGKRYQVEAHTRAIQKWQSPSARSWKAQPSYSIKRYICDLHTVLNTERHSRDVTMQQCLWEGGGSRTSVHTFRWHLQ